MCGPELASPDVVNQFEPPHQPDRFPMASIPELEEWGAEKAF
jgi:hypothetical protein